MDNREIMKLHFAIEDEIKSHDREWKRYKFRDSVIDAATGIVDSWELEELNEQLKGWKPDLFKIEITDCGILGVSVMEVVVTHDIDDAKWTKIVNMWAFCDSSSLMALRLYRCDQTREPVLLMDYNNPCYSPFAAGRYYGNAN